jgi:hypothetical protein
MRRVTRNAVLAVLAVIAVALALGAVPSLLGSGDPYYLRATPMNGSDAPEGIEPANASALFEESYPYTFGAIADAGPDGGRSDPYRMGRFGLKGAFTHSPFDEMRAYEAQYPVAVRDDAAYVRGENTTYRLDVIQP